MRRSRPENLWGRYGPNRQRNEPQMEIVPQHPLALRAWRGGLSSCPPSSIHRIATKRLRG